MTDGPEPQRGPALPRLTMDDPKRPVASTGEEIVSLKDVGVWYGDYHALRGVSMSMRRNEITALIGPSGCGKSTLLRSLNRMNDGFVMCLYIFIKDKI